MCASYGLGGQGRPIYIRGLDIFPDEMVDTANQTLASWVAGHPGPIRPTGVKARNFTPIITPKGVQESWWGMWAGDAPAKFSTINATVERLTTGLWAGPYKRGRALAPATEYYEYKNLGAKKQRYAFRLPDGAPFMIAAIAKRLPDEPELPRTSYAIITRPPTERAAEIHNRMPLLIPASFTSDWLDPEQIGDDDLRQAALTASEEIAQQLVYEPA